MTPSQLAGVLGLDEMDAILPVPLLDEDLDNAMPPTSDAPQRMRLRRIV